MEVLFLLNLNKYYKCVSCQLERIRDERCGIEFFFLWSYKLNSIIHNLKCKTMYETKLCVGDRLTINIMFDTVISSTEFF